MVNLPLVLVVPIPTLPLESIRTRSAPFVAAANVSAAGEKHPVFGSPLKLYVGFAALPVAVATSGPLAFGDCMPVELNSKT